MIFKASLDRMAKVISVVITIVFAFIILFPFFENWEDIAAYEIYRSVGLTILFLVILAYSPRQYAITDDALVIFRFAGNVIIPKSTIASVQILDKEFPFSIRTFGVDGLFGYFGTFYNRVNGKMTCYITNRHHGVLITTDYGRKFVISPDENDAFLNAL